jgi:hypothetical protein
MVPLNATSDGGLGTAADLGSMWRGAVNGGALVANMESA